MPKGDTFHSRHLGLFREPQRHKPSLLARLFKRGTSLGHPRFGASFASIIPGSDIDTNPIGDTREALEQYNGWVFAAASFIAEEVRALEWDVWLKRGNRRDEWEIDTGPINDVLNKPNADMSWGDLIELSDLHYSTAGEFYWHVITSPSGRALGLEVIYPHWVQEPIITDGRLTGWRVARPGSAPVIIPAHEVIRVHRPHPLSPFHAASIVEAAAVSHYFDLYLRAYGMTLLRNDGGIPAGVLKSDQDITVDQAAEMSARWEERFSQTRGKVAAFGKGAGYQPIAIPIGDLNLLSTGQFTREQVLSLFRVAPSMLGLITDSNRANMEAALWGFQRHTLRPRAMKYAEVVRSRVIPLFTSPAEARRRFFEFRDVVGRDRDRDRREANDMLKSGSITVNEYRERMGGNPLEGGDVFMVPTSVRIVERLEPEPPPEPPTQDTTQGDDSRSIPARLEAATARGEAERLAAENHELRIQAAERKHYTDLRGFFARCYRDSKNLERIRFPVAELEERGIDVTAPYLTAAEDESLTQHAERLKSHVAKQLARELAEREVTA